MQTTILALVALSAASPIIHNPISARNVTVCGPTSNCYITYEADGIARYHFKPGMEPGSADHTRRFAKAKRQDSITTEIALGRTSIDYGCDANVAEMFRNALNDLCELPGACDSNTFTQTGTRPLPYGSVDPVYEDMTLEFRGSGAYASSLRENLIEALVGAPATSGAVEGYYLEVPDETTGDGSGVAPGECNMNKFTNLVQVTRVEGEDLQSYMRIDIVNTWTPDTPDWCMLGDILNAVVGTVSGIGAGVFGLVTATMC